MRVMIPRPPTCCFVWTQRERTPEAHLYRTRRLNAAEQHSALWKSEHPRPLCFDSCSTKAMGRVVISVAFFGSPFFQQLKATGVIVLNSVVKMRIGPLPYAPRRNPGHPIIPTYLLTSSLAGRNRVPFLLGVLHQPRRRRLSSPRALGTAPFHVRPTVTPASGPLRNKSRSTVSGNSHGDGGSGVVGRVRWRRRR